MFIRRQNTDFIDKITLFSQYEKPIYYDLVVLCYNKLYFFQTAINEKNSLINELINSKHILINSIMNNIEYFSDRRVEIKEIYCYIILANMESIYQNNNDDLLTKLVSDNKKYNMGVAQMINKTKFGLLFLGKEGKIYDEKMNIIVKGIAPNKNYDIYKNNWEMEMLTDSIKI